MASLIFGDINMLDDVLYYFPPAQPAADFSHMRQVAAVHNPEQPGELSRRGSDESRPEDSGMAPPGSVFDDSFASHFLTALEHRVTSDFVVQQQAQQQWRPAEHLHHAHGPVHSSRRSKGAIVPPCAVCGKQFACQSKVGWCR